ncbi:MAG TPA: aldehyde ferredoxin oxidoreductase C-terminal domain-containing protein [Planctomycetota bacterium]|nr:aldehyde ferredoxin oxidoreductase C-terminal domain-containing protein [Planctomycetota bacterium]
MLHRHHLDISTGGVRREEVTPKDLEDALGGIGRATKLLLGRRVADPFSPMSPLILNLGALSGTGFMTGLRTFFHGFSPLKTSNAGLPGAMWSAGSGDFGTRLRGSGIEEVILTGRAARPSVLRLPSFTVEPIDLKGTVNERMQALHRRYPHAHFAAIGPAGEHRVRYAAIALSTGAQLRGGDPKPRFCGRGGFGAVMGAKNLLAIVAEGDDPKLPPPSPRLKELNLAVARGEGSRRFRERGTWGNYESLHPVHALPEMNFAPTGTDASRPLLRPEFEKGPYEVRDESCLRCGIRCHKNVYDKEAGGVRGRFRAKLDYEPLCLLASNLGIFDPDAALDLVLLADEMGLDSISLGATLSYAMELARRRGGELRYGDVAATKRTIERIAKGELPQLGQGVRRLADAVGEPGFAMHSKGIEYPAYLPQTNPGYPFALAGGHMSMRTYLLLLYERETSLDYWVEAIAERGIRVLRDDLLGACKFAGLPDEQMAEALREAAGIETTAGEIEAAVKRTYLRGYRLEKEQGFLAEDYAMPEEVHGEFRQIDLPRFNTKEFFGELRTRVLTRLDEQLAAAGV